MRVRKLRKILSEKGTFPYLITDLNNIRYLTGFTGSNAYVVVDEARSYFITDSRYEEYVESILPKSFRFVLQDGSFPEALKSCLSYINKKILYVEPHSMTLLQYNDLKKSLKGVRMNPVNNDPVNYLRMFKGKEEIEILREAASITDRCFYHLLNFVRPGLTEWDVAVEIELFYKRNGCTACSFDPIVASGKGASMPHYRPAMDKKIANGDVLLVDMGCIYKGYNSDLTRTLFLGKIDSRLEEIYNIVYEAQAEALKGVRSGISAGQLDEIARGIITDYGYGENFGHGLGHGLGIEIHEMPSVKKNSNIQLEKNMVITIEPGIYIPGKGGVRIEDMVLVRQGGCEVLTGCTRELIVI